MLTFYVEDQVHHRVRRFVDDPANSFLQVARRCAVIGTRVLDVIDPYADAMLNFIQLDRLIDELNGLLSGGLLSETERVKVIEVLDGAAESRRISGYLFIEGD
ncbi:MAG TPA: hypothetical protein VIS06_09880 [Mycobacteriales bacterium]|jgi:hypothetical protein